MKHVIIKAVSSIFTCDFHLYEAELEALALIKKHDEYTYLHSLNVARLSVSLGRRLGFSHEMMVDLGWTALLHDLGKLNVPIEILNKIKKFTAEELKVMQSHPVQALVAFGRTQRVTLDGLRRLSAAFEHHQRYDLKGYPSVHGKLSLHPFSRIVAVADTFDAMTTDRIYQRRVLPEVALKIMSQGFGTIFDPTVLQAFITCMGVFPIGSLVRLSDERLAVVVAYHENSSLDRPAVRLVEEPANPTIDLMSPDYQDLKILRSEFPEDHGVQVEDYLGEVA